MANRIYLAKNFFFEVDVSFTQVIIIAVMAALMFFGPVYIHGRLSQNQTVAATEQPITETYTQSALTQNTNPQVAGTSTQRADADSVQITVPLLNLKFDPTFQDKASLPIAFGFIFGTVSFTIVVILLIDYLRK